MAQFYQVEEFTAANSIGFLVCRSKNRIVAMLEGAFAEQALSFTQWRALMCLRDKVSHTAAELSRELEYDSGSLTRLLDDFEARGLVKRRRSKLDRRIVELELTASGRALLRTLIPRVAELFNRALRGLSYAEVDTLVALLRKLLAGVETVRSDVDASPGAAPRRKSA